MRQPEGAQPAAAPGAAFAKIPGHDVCLTTYPLLWRDRKLAAHAYHSLILDEAQTVKNAASQAAQVVRTLRAEHRLCLTGTPLENHLGELWSQFDFLLPGLPGDTKGFRRPLAHPIEKRGDVVRREILARRIAPSSCAAARKRSPGACRQDHRGAQRRARGRQRDLYETVRATMDQRIRDEIAARGFAAARSSSSTPCSLRQVAATRACSNRRRRLGRERAKLDLLMDMLPELVDEGRRVLLFSQFTSMLDLIAAELDARKIPFVTLTGDTAGPRNAGAQVSGRGRAVFLISLKAGGVGLNPTAADTVIHYDPWWNPPSRTRPPTAPTASTRPRRCSSKLVVASSIGASRRRSRASVKFWRGRHPRLLSQPPYPGQSRRAKKPGGQESVLRTMLRQDSRQDAVGRAPSPSPGSFGPGRSSRIPASVEVGMCNV